MFNSTAASNKSMDVRVRQRLCYNVARLLSACVYSVSPHVNFAVRQQKKVFSSKAATACANFVYDVALPSKHALTKNRRFYMLTKLRFVAFVLACAAGVGSTFFSSIFQPSVKGFSQEEARAKVGQRVKLKADSVSVNPKTVNRGVVAYSQLDHGERVLVIDWNEKLSGWKHRITQIDRNTYQKVIEEE